MDPLHLCIALGPLGVYLLLLGIVNLIPRPFVTNGTRDTVALAVAVSGLIVAGPMELFAPQAAAVRWGTPVVLLLLLGFYVLGTTFLVLMMRPRLVIYNMTLEQLRPVLAELVSQLDPEARWARDTLVMPKLHLQFNIEAQVAMRNVQLVAIGSSQSFGGWRRLENTLRASLADLHTKSNPYGLSFLMFAVLILGMVAYWMAADRQAVAEALRDMLRL